MGKPQSVKMATNCVVCGGAISVPEQGHRRCDRHLAGEEWRDIPEYVGLYQASNFGRIRSCPRAGVNIRRMYGGQVLIQSHHGPRKLICLSRDNVRTTYGVHGLIAKAFLGPANGKDVVAHWDGDPTNNDLPNLRWATYAENEEDKRRHDRHTAGVRNPSAKLTWDDVCRIRAKVAGGAFQNEVAREYGISATQCCDIVKGKAWSSGGNERRRILRAQTKLLRANGSSELLNDLGEIEACGRAPTPAGRSADIYRLKPAHPTDGGGA